MFKFKEKEEIKSLTKEEAFNLLTSEEKETDLPKLEVTEPEEQWEWIKGYKITNFDGTCKNFQYEVGKTYSLPEGEKPILCSKGFHFCTNIKALLHYYDIGRVFKVSGYVNINEIINRTKSPYPIFDEFKMVASKIKIERELTFSELKAQLFTDDLYPFLKTEQDWNNLLSYAKIHQQYSPKIYYDWCLNIYKQTLQQYNIDERLLNKTILNEIESTDDIVDLYNSLQFLEGLLNTMKNKDFAIFSWINLHPCSKGE